jgi:hypothetical protein
MRPIGDFRAALRTAAAAAGPAGATWRELGERACLARAPARMTVENMRRAGELVVVGQARVPGTNRPAVRVAAAALLPSPSRVAFDSLARAWAPQQRAQQVAAAYPAMALGWTDFV